MPGVFLVAVYGRMIIQIKKEGGDVHRKTGAIMGKRRIRLLGSIFLSVVLILYACSLMAAPQTVYVIPVEDIIDQGLARFVERGYQEAEQAGAALVILEVDTPGGLIDSAKDIRDTIWDSSIPSVALVSGRAISAGAFITVACPQIAMMPGTTIGDAEARINGQRADEKYLSAWTQEFAATAERNGRDPEIARAMVDRDIEIPGLVEKGKLLTFTYSQAQEHGYADYTVADRAELLEKLGLNQATIIEENLTVAERLTRIVTSPYIAPLLLTIGIAGIIIEIFTFGWGVAGTLGIISLILYFGGHLMAGFSGWGVLLLFIIGVILLVIEMFIPGFGVLGIGGIISIFASIILAAPSWEAGLTSLVLALIGTVILVLIAFRFLTKRKFWSRLTLATRYNKEDGYVPQSQDYSIYQGQKGQASTTLRPAGTVILDDGTRVDVVTQGEFIERGERIQVLAVEGIRIIVGVAPVES